MTYREARTLKKTCEIKVKDGALRESGELVRVLDVKFHFSGRTPYAMINVCRKRDNRNIDWFYHDQLEFIKNE